MENEWDMLNAGISHFYFVRGYDMSKNNMSVLNGSLLWFGAAVSIAEILTGTLLAPLGFAKGLLAILLGHLIGCTLFYFAGLVGAKSDVSAMQSVGLSFGRFGSVFFSVLNILQLLGWTAVMILSGAEALGSVFGKTGFWGNALWCALIGAMVVVWMAAGLKNLGKLNNVAVFALLALSAVLVALVFRGGSAGKATGSLTFGMGLELSVAMPVSWLPLIADYTRHTDRPRRLTFFSTAAYFVGSSLMYLTGLGAALFAGSADIVKILSRAGLGVAAMLIVLLATVTTTFLDVYSAGESMNNILPKLNAKAVGIAVGVVGTVIAVFTPIERFEDFLYLIGSVFVPMAAILITDYFILKKRSDGKKLDVFNAVLWVLGFVIYRLFLKIDTVLGSTIPVFLLVMLLCIAANLIRKRVLKHV